MPIGSSAIIADTWLLGDRSPGGRTDTGTSERSTAWSGSSERASSMSRNAPEMTARTTSFTVPPKARLIALMSARSARADAHRRCGPMGPTMDRARRGASWAPALAKPSSTARSSRAARRGVCASDLIARAYSTGLWSNWPSESARSIASLGSGAGTQCSAGTTGESRLGSRSVAINSVPDTPSTMQWCTLEINAHWSSGSPSMIQASHSGRWRSSSWDMTRPIRLSRSERRPGGRQRGVADVVVEVEVRIVHPDGTTDPTGREADLLPVARDERQLARDQGHHLVVRRGRSLEHGARADVHVGDAVLDAEEDAVERAHVLHRARASHAATSGDRVLRPRRRGTPALAPGLSPPRGRRPARSIVRAGCREGIGRSPALAPAHP